MIDRRQLAIDRLMKSANRRLGRATASGEQKRNAIICGPPGAGKTKYVTDNGDGFDFVFDYDGILSALTLLERGQGPSGSLDLMMALRERYIERSVADHKSRFWLISATPHDSRRKLMASKMGARIIYIATPAEVCLERIGRDPARNGDMDHWAKIVGDWWAGFNPGDEDMVIN